MPTEDKVLQCVECPDTFKFTIGEQKYYNEKGFKEPKRCGICRQNKKMRNARNDDKHFNGYN